jgi:hypothetical protein
MAAVSPLTAGFQASVSAACQNISTLDAADASGTTGDALDPKLNKAEELTRLADRRAEYGRNKFILHKADFSAQIRHYFHYDLV